MVYCVRITSATTSHLVSDTHKTFYDGFRALGSCVEKRARIGNIDTQDIADSSLLLTTDCHAV